jgi:hypothetical protein
MTALTQSNTHRKKQVPAYAYVGASPGALKTIHRQSGTPCAAFHRQGSKTAAGALFTAEQRGLNFPDR